ncbi:MAG: DUF1761 domain-containing protein [Gammaproteobacteria bacterium]|nr:DUF1761 domain-containing protein [Gammaproteobacteria bacterium]MDD9895577.1 DUF1761 domain-containing protein [Gammaproteobacteria bacterium]MDD9959724.1 DUF1761 domain-containing protein [Gammaproteobacteria bacterium]
MDMGTAAGAINWISVSVAALSSFMVGGIWYGPIFGHAWMEAFNLTEEDLAKRNMPMVFGVSLLLALIAAINLEMFIGAEATLAFGSFAGFAAGLGWVAAFLGIIYLFENQSMKAYLINAGYCVVALTLMGAILGAW